MVPVVHSDVHELVRDLLYTDSRELHTAYTRLKTYSIPYLINQDPHWVLKLISAN